MNKLGRNEFSYSTVRSGGIIGNYREIASVLADQLVDQPFRCPDRHETSDHQLAPSGIMATDC